MTPRASRFTAGGRACRWSRPRPSPGTQDLVQGQDGPGHWGWTHTLGHPRGAIRRQLHPRSARAAGLRWYNGIIENYMELREFLQSEEDTFVSQTDTEVVAQLLEHYYDGDILDAVVKTLNRIQGLRPGHCLRRLP